MAGAIDDFLSTTDSALGTITGGIKGFRDALNTGENRVEPASKWDAKTIALYVGGGLVGVLVLIFVVKKVL